MAVPVGRLVLLEKFVIVLGTLCLKFQVKINFPPIEQNRGSDSIHTNVSGVIRPIFQVEVSHSLPPHWTGLPRSVFTYRASCRAGQSQFLVQSQWQESRPYPLPTVQIIRSSFPDMTSQAQPSLLLIVP